MLRLCSLAGASDRASASPMRPGPARKTKSRHPPRWRKTLEGPEDHGRIEPRSCTKNLTIVRRQRQRLSFIRRGWSDPSAAEKINDLQGLAGFGAKPFRLAKLTACRSVAYLSAVRRSVKAE